MKSFTVALLCLVAGAQAASQSPRGDKEERLFFGSYRTITNTGVTLTTSTVYASCVSGSATTTCGGRKRRSAALLNIADVDAESERSSGKIDSSIEEASAGEPRSPTGKLSGIYTIWTTATTSTTVTYRYTDTATTVSLSIYCS